MPTGTYEPIATNTLTSAQTSIDFTSIPQTYTDLVLVSNIQGQANGCNMQIWFNSDGASNTYSTTVLFSGSNLGNSARASNLAKINFGTNGGQPYANSNQFGLNIHNILNYSNSTTYKTVLASTLSPNDGYNSAEELVLGVGMWRNTAAITTISVGVDNSKQMPIDSTITLYGIKAE